MEINSISNLTKLNVTSSTKISSHMPSLADVDCSCSDDEDEFGMYINIIWNCYCFLFNFWIYLSHISEAINQHRQFVQHAFWKPIWSAILSTKI